MVGSPAAMEDRFTGQSISDTEKMVSLQPPPVAAAL
jgi:hypothetical protein